MRMGAFEGVQVGMDEKIGEREGKRELERKRKREKEKKRKREKEKKRKREKTREKRENGAPSRSSGCPRRP